MREVHKKLRDLDPFGFLNHKDGTDRSSQNVGKKLLLLVA